MPLDGKQGCWLNIGDRDGFSWLNLAGRNETTVVAKEIQSVVCFVVWPTEQGLIGRVLRVGLAFFVVCGCLGRANEDIGVFVGLKR